MRIAAYGFLFIRVIMNKKGGMTMPKLLWTIIAVAIVIPLCIVLFGRTTLNEAVAGLNAPQAVTKPVEKSKPVEQPTVVEKPVQKTTPKKAPAKKKVVKKKQQPKPVIVIDPSHQQFKDVSLEYVAPNSNVKRAKQLASATGVVTAQKEYHVTMTMAKKLRTQLEKKGYKVVFTRAKHDVQLSNRVRAKRANKANAQLVISLHADGGKYYQRGFYVMTASKKATPKYYEQSKRQAKRIVKAVAKHDKIFSKGQFEREDITLFNYTKAPAVSIQLGFLTNVKDDQKLANDKYLETLAKWIAAGVKPAK